MGLRTATDTAPVTTAWSRPVPASQAVIASGDYKATDPTPVELTPPLQARILMLFINVTAQTGAGNTITWNIEGWDPASQTWFALGTAITDAVGGAHTKTYFVNPDLAAAATVLQAVVPETIRIRPVGSGTRTTLNYSCSAHWSL